MLTVWAASAATAAVELAQLDKVPPASHRACGHTPHPLFCTPRGRSWAMWTRSMRRPLPLAAPSRWGSRLARARRRWRNRRRRRRGGCASRRAALSLRRVSLDCQSAAACHAQAVEALVKGFDTAAAEEKGRRAAAGVKSAAEAMREDILLEGGSEIDADIAMDATAQAAPLALASPP